jgi:NitT/TauT family transport system substrate-binding protein
LRHGEGLKGSRIIAGGAGSSKTTVANALALSAGLALNDLTLLPTEGRDMNAEALRQGRAELLVAPVPDGADYLRRGVAEVYLDLTGPETTRQRFGTLFPSATVFMSSDRVKAHPEIAQHLATAFVRALRFLNTHSAEEIVALLPKDFFGKDREAALNALAAELPMFATDGRMPADGARFEWGVLAKADPRLAAVDVERTYTDAFVDRALAAAR